MSVLSRLLGTLPPHQSGSACCNLLCKVRTDLCPAPSPEDRWESVERHPSSLTAEGGRWIAPRHLVYTTCKSDLMGNDSPLAVPLSLASLFPFLLPTSVSWEHFPMKPSVLQSASQGAALSKMLGCPRLREMKQIAQGWQGEVAHPELDSGADRFQAGLLNCTLELLLNPWSQRGLLKSGPPLGGGP